jgi:hypothetical protein
MSNGTLQRHSHVPSIPRVKPHPLSGEAAALACIVMLMILTWLYCLLEDRPG